MSSRVIWQKWQDVRPVLWFQVSGDFQCPSSQLSAERSLHTRWNGWGSWDRNILSKIYPHGWEVTIRLESQPVGCTFSCEAARGYRGWDLFVPLQDRGSNPAKVFCVKSLLHLGLTGWCLQCARTGWLRTPNVRCEACWSEGRTECLSIWKQLGNMLGTLCGLFWGHCAVDVAVPFRNTFLVQLLSKVRWASLRPFCICCCVLQLWLKC